MVEAIILTFEKKHW